MGGTGKLTEEHHCSRCRNTRGDSFQAQIPRSAGRCVQGSCVTKAPSREGVSDPKKGFANQPVKRLQVKARVWKLPGMSLVRHLPRCPQARQAGRKPLLCAAWPRAGPAARPARRDPRVTSPTACRLLAPLGHQHLKLTLQTRLYQTCTSSAFVSEEGKSENIPRDAALSPPCIQLSFSDKSP